MCHNLILVYNQPSLYYYQCIIYMDQIAVYNTLLWNNYIIEFKV